MISPDFPDARKRFRMNRRERRRQAKEAKGASKGGKAAEHGLRAEQLALAGKLRAEKGVDIQPLVIDVSAPSADSRPAAKKADTANKKAKTKARKKSKKSKSKTKSKRKRARKGATT